MIDDETICWGKLISSAKKIGTKRNEFGRVGDIVAKNDRRYGEARMAREWGEGLRRE